MLAVPLVPEIRLHTASEPSPLWSATQEWLTAHAVEPPYWAFPWAGGQAVARYVLDNPELVRGKAVLDFASGSGLVAIAARLAGAARVVAVDIDPLAIEATTLNAALNGVSVETVCEDWLSRDRSGFDVVLAGDVFYEAPLSRAATSWFRQLAADGAVVLAGDPGRSYVPDDVPVVARYEVPVPPELEGSTSRRSVVLRFVYPLAR